MFDQNTSPSDTKRRRSTALPWLPSPSVLASDASFVGTTDSFKGGLGPALEGNAGFDPAGFAVDRRKLFELRDAELKHSRLAMVSS
jgi:hypothetical protein